MTARRLGPGLHTAHTIRAAQADLLDTLPGVGLPDVGELCACGVLGTRPTTPPRPQRILGVGGRADDALGVEDHAVHNRPHPTEY